MGPCHVAVIFDPSGGNDLRLEVVDPPPLHPMVLPRAYRYDEFDDRIEVIAAGQGGPFTRYHDLFCELLDRPRTDFVGRRSGATATARELAKVASGATWLVVADRGIEPTLRIDGCRVVDRRTEGGRDLITFTAHPEAIEEVIADAVRNAGLVPSPETVRRALSEVVDLGGEALLGVLRGKAGAGLSDPRRAKGLIGVLSVVRWYRTVYPEALLVSLDEPETRRWITGDEEGRRGDLLAVRMGNTDLYVEVIEVKTHDDPDAELRTRGERVEGPAVTQVDVTLDRFSQLLTSDEISSLNQARREVLRDQLYRAVAIREIASELRRRQVKFLEDLFSQNRARVSGLIAKVRIEHGVPRVSPSAPYPMKSPAGHTVHVLELVESEELPIAEDRQRSVWDLAAVCETERRQYPPSATSGALGTGRLRILLGKDPADNEVMWDPSNPERPSNNFGILVTGDAGVGKTQLLRVVIHECVRAGLPVMVFDFKNDYAPQDFAGIVPLRVYDVNREGLPFNPLHLVGGQQAGQRPVTHIHEVAGILRRVFGLGDQQESRLKAALKTAYQQHGIVVERMLEGPSLLDAPDFAEVVTILRSDSRNEALLNRVAPLFDLNLFPSSSAAITTFEELLRDRVVLDLHSLPDDRIKAALAEFVIVRLHGHILRGEQLRRLTRLLVFDEAWRVARSEKLIALAREGRAFGVAIALGTQFPGDIADEMAGNLATQVFLHNEQSEHQKAVARALCGSGSGPEAQRLIRQLKLLSRHEGFVRNQQHSPFVKLRATPHYERNW